MNRRDKFKQERVLQHKLKLTLFLCCVLLVAGICAVDYSTNVLMYNREALGFVKVDNYKTHLELSLFNEKVYINTQYLSRDLEKLVKLLGR